MKKLLLITLSILMLFSCSGDDDTTPQNVLVKWKFKANGVLYQWEGTSDYSATSGTSSYLKQPGTYPSISLSSPGSSSANIEVMFRISFPNETTGPFIINSSTAENSASLILNGVNYATTLQLGQCQINLNVIQIATAAGGITKGTFSGTMKKLDFTNATLQITEGSFESVRFQ